MKKIIKKVLISFLVITIYIILNIICGNKQNIVFAVNQTVSTDINSIDSNKYPQVKEIITSLKKQHPNWNFKILYTDLDWYDVIANEYVGHGKEPRSLITATDSKYKGDWICKVCGEKIYDNKTHCASEEAIGYMMDPRNSLNKSDIFQFMQLSYSDYNEKTVKEMVNGTFLNNNSYINAIINSAKKYNANVYYLIARILQEQGSEGSALSKGQGYEGQYVGYYNIFNVDANGNGGSNIVLKGLKYAESKGWNTIEKSIEGGTELVAKNYIAKGQDTLYFQKFDVENSDGNLYWHQYMQSILAAQNEGTTLRKTFEKAGFIEANYTFIIPVYKNMPSSAVKRPSTTSTNTSTSTDLVKINVTNSLWVRSEPKKSATKVASVFKNEIVTRLSKATEMVDGTYWDYIKKSDGTKGYVARQTYDYESTYKLYLVPVNEENASDNNQQVSQNNKLKINKDTNQIMAVPGATVGELANVMGETITVNNNGQILDSNSKLITGSTVNEKYTISVLGDVNGDGEVKSTDYMAIKNVIMGTKELSEVEKKAADVNGDGNIKSTDYMKIKNYIMGSAKIEL